jgi:protein disulfide-isomerase A1
LELPIGYIFVPSLEDSQRFVEVLRPFVQQHRSKMLFTIGNTSELEDIAEDLHLQPTQDSAAFAIRDTAKYLRYPMNIVHGGFVDSVQDFVKQFFAGELKPIIKSEPVPPDTDEALVKVVGSTYDDIVVNNTKDVLMVYCIVPCGPCEELKPDLQGLARMYQSDTKLSDLVTIGIIDYDLNDIPEIEIRAFPTIKLFPAADKTHPVLYLGDRGWENLADFIRNCGSHKADLRDQGRSEEVLGPSSHGEL